MDSRKRSSLVPLALLAGLAVLVWLWPGAGFARDEPTGGRTPAAAPAQGGADKGTVLVTGANRGIGLALAKQFREAGYAVIGTARDPAEAKELAALGARVLPLDVTSAESVRALAAALKDQPIDMLVNNAGVGNRGERLETVDFDAVQRTLAVNTIGPMRVTQALLPNLRLGSRKIVASISSRLASIELNTSGGYHGYRESKSALNQFMRSLAAELRDEGFICVALSPGWVRTDMGGSSAPLSPDESAAGLRAVIEGLSPQRSGSFLSHDGTELPW